MLQRRKVTEDISLAMQVSDKQLDSFCKKFINRSRNMANTHEALMVLEAFISAFSSDSLAADNYKKIQQILTLYSDKTREQLMSEKTQQLTQGLLTQNMPLLSDVYCSLSRNGFYQILSKAIDPISPTKRAAIAQWVIGWAEDARQKAEQASGYPDALDFKKANINIEHYQAMTDIAYFFNNTYEKNKI
jgi:hypothetical protein